MLYLSASALSAYFACPAKYEYGLRWEALETPVAIQDGLDAHAILAGERVEKPSARARSFANRARELYEGLGYRPLLVDGRPIREVKQRISLPKSAVLSRIIDHIAIDPADGKPVIVDWKTGTWPWHSDAFATPQSMGFQAVIYTLPPAAADFLGLDEWPRRISFFSVPEKGENKVYTYEPTEEDEKNLWQAVKLMRLGADERLYPKLRGYQCNTGKTKCPFYEVCYNIPGWEKLYKERKHDRR